MSYIWLLLVMAICALIYVHTEHPHAWNKYLNELKAPSPLASSPSPAVAPPTSEMPSPPAPTPIPATLPVTQSAPANTPEIISPDSNAFLNPDHVRPVDQATPQKPPENK